MLEFFQKYTHVNVDILRCVLIEYQTDELFQSFIGIRKHLVR